MNEHELNEHDMKEFATQVVEKASQPGTDAECFFLKSEELTVEVAGEKVETIKSANESGIGIRIINGGRMGFAYTSDLSAKAVENTISRALANSRQVSLDENNLLPSPAGNYPEVDVYDEEILQTSLENKIEYAMEMEKEAKNYDSRVKLTERSAYQDVLFAVAVANSKGVNNWYRGSNCGAYVFIVAEEDGDHQTGFAVQSELSIANLRPAEIGREAARKAVQMLRAQKIPTQRSVVVFDPYPATSFLGVIAPALTAEAVQKGRSLFAGKLGERVAGDVVNIVDDGRLKGGLLSAPFDGEGNPTSNTGLIEGGILKGYLHNMYTSLKADANSTGNGTRGSYKSLPEVGTTNFYICPGQISPDALIKEVEDGFYLTEVMGMHTANPISGDFSVGAAGLRIENGELTSPVRGIAIAGNIVQLLQKVDAVADDLTFFGGRGAPTLRVTGLSLSGS